ncbi:MAG: hypothetical protein RSB41_03195, partial [Bacilli bacterium]
TIKTTIDNWFAANMTEERTYLSEDSVYCNDRGLSSGTGVGQTNTSYNANARLSSKKRPDYRCSQINDRFTTSTATKGNKKLTYPVGLITADETSFAGGMLFVTNNNYLNTAQYYWSLSPGFSNHGNFATISMYSDGQLNINGVNSGRGVRPVLSLKPNSNWKSGNGTASNPYEIKM